DAIGARDVATRVLTLAPDNPRRALIHATAQLFLADGTSPADVAQRAAAAAIIIDVLSVEPSLMSVSSIAGPLALTLDRMPHGIERDDVVLQVARIAIAS